MNELIGVYAAKHRDSDVRSASRSGGVFTAISDYILKEKGVVFGCVLLDDFMAYHVKATKVTERDEMRGSKYIQSNMGDTFGEVKQELKSGKNVLFSGTSCQIDGLKHFLGKNYDNLLCIDIVCHGVPSPKVWQEYLKWQEERIGEKFISVEFRNKTDFGWKAHIETMYTEKGKSINSSVFKELFYGHNILRPACYECKYKSKYHPGDITIADYWGIDNAVPGFNDNKGISLVLINSDIGKRYYDIVKSELESISTDINKSLQPPLQYPFPRPDTRDKFWSEFKTKDFEYIAKKYGGLKSPVYIFIIRCKGKIKSIYRRLFGRRSV